MITPGEIKKKALRHYKACCLAYVCNEQFFPLVIPGKRGKSTDPYLARKRGLETLIAGSKENKTYGYSLEWEEINTRDYGVQSMVKRIFFQEREDYLTFIGKKKDFENICRVTELIRRDMPILEEWIKCNPLSLETPVTVWPDILRVCSWFLAHPSPHLYIRELPIPVHTKFIEENSSLLISLLDFLLPPEHVNTPERQFAGRYHLRWDEPLIRCRLQSLPGQEDDISRPLSLFTKHALPGRSVFIIENKINFLSFPLEDQRLVIWGKGFFATVLKDVPWLSSRYLYYWGDIDCPGFEILSAMRAYFPEIKSFLMDREVYEKYSKFAVPCDTGKDILPAYLTEEEKALYSFLKENPSRGRLEQERIPHDEVFRGLER
ncbi:MAG: hypothetical protein JXJ04_18955 [Spirochaetales bacterium]|nr:hypothetical protein [Spirochaetales bacterium]